MLPFDGIYGWLLRYLLSKRSQVVISSFGVNHKNDFESSTNVCENISSGSKYNLLGTSKAMASKSSHSNLKKLKSFEYCSFEVQRAYVKNSKPFTGGVLLKLTNKTYKIITVHFNERLKRT